MNAARSVCSFDRDTPNASAVSQSVAPMRNFISATSRPSSIAPLSVRRQSAAMRPKASRTACAQARVASRPSHGATRSTIEASVALVPPLPDGPPADGLPSLVARWRLTMFMINQN